ncbi:MAG: hypothetical protein K2N44_17990 [Lachnospiraceae bacterium]|nr:hypothetical protein [Lachnospiraceae bacterium]
MICAPDHIKKYVTPIVGKNKFFEDSIYSSFTFAYEVHCSCGGKEMTVYKTSEPKVTAVCAACGRMITIYDLTEYPCAVPLGKEETPEKVTNQENDRFHVAVIYEYSDEFALDDDAYDENDVTWCQIYVYDTVNAQSIMIVDDETA